MADDLPTGSLHAVFLPPVRRDATAALVAALGATARDDRSASGAAEMGSVFGASLLLGVPAVLVAVPWEDDRAVWFAATAGFLLGATVLGAAWRAQRRAAATLAARVRSLADSLEIEREAAATARAEAQRAEAAASLVLASLGNELRTPLHGLLGMTEALAGTGLSAHQRRHLEAIRRGAEQLGGVLQDALDRTRVLHGEVELVLRDVDLRDLVDDVLEQHAPAADTRGLELTSVIDRRLGQAVRVDEVRLKQILGNLVSNAVKFTERGSVVVRAGLAPGGPVADGRLAVRFEVVDTGPGIAVSERDTIFEPFRRSEALAGREVSGLGIGLAVARRLADAIGGRLGLSPTERGSAFHLDVELELAPSTGAAMVASPELRGLAIAVVGASAGQEEGLCALLSGLGCPAERLGGGGRWDDRARGGAPGLALLVTTGAEDRWRRDLAIVREELGPSARVLLLTPLTQPVDRGVAQAAGAAGVLRAPFRARLLLEALEAARAPRAVPNPSLPRAAVPSAATSVLIVDDNPLNREVLQAWCEQLEVGFALAADGEEAVERCRGRRFDAILMDCHMPRLDGVGATGRIRTGRGPNAATPIVAVTADARPDFLQWCRDAGMSDALPKPLRLPQLVEVLRRCVPHWAPPESTEAAAEPSAGFDSQRTLERTRPVAVVAEPEGTRAMLAMPGMLEQWGSSNRETLDRIVAGLAAAQLDEAARAAHFLKSNCALAEARAAWSSCQALEDALKGGRLDDAQHHLRELRSELDRIAAELKVAS